MCGEDGAQREVYKLKEEPEKGGSEREKRKKKNEETERNKREESKRGKVIYFTEVEYL